METATTSPAQKLFRVSYVETVVRQTFILAANEDEACDLIEQEIADGAYHHALDTYQDDLQAEPADESTRCRCFDCAKGC